MTALALCLDAVATAGFSTPINLPAAAMLCPSSTNRAAGCLNSIVQLARTVCFVCVRLARKKTFSKGSIFCGKVKAAVQIFKHSIDGEHTEVHASMPRHKKVA